MKKIIMLLVAMMLVFSVSGQAMAYFADGELIRVVYSSTDASGKEFATDLGNITSLTAPSTANTIYNTNNFSQAAVGATSWSNMYVAYYSITQAPTTGPTNQVWTSGPTSGQTANSGQYSAILGAIHYANGLYSISSTTATATALQSDPASYWNAVNKGLGGQGMFNGFIRSGGGDASLAALATAGYVDQTLYYYANPNGSRTGGVSNVQAATIRTFADGHTELNPVPVPPALYLFGSGLLGLVGIRRKMAA